MTIFDTEFDGDQPENLELEVDRDSLDRMAGTAPWWSRDAGRPPEMTLVIPTRNEADNIPELLRQLECALVGADVEILFVDDSDDATPLQIRSCALEATHPVGVLHRTPGHRSGGLGSAVVAGFRQAHAPWAIVMDGDLQHPPEVIPLLVAATHEPSVDLVVASRYSGTGSATGLDGRWRTSVSALSTRLSKLLFPQRLRGISDPMSGFFAVRLETLDLETLRPPGYKILLEILARSRFDGTADVPYSFRERFAGQSKASLSQGIKFIRQLLLLRMVATFAPLQRVTAFLGVGLSGVVVNTAVLWALTAPAHLHYLIAAAAATQVAIVWNFLLLDRLVFSTHRQGRARGRFGRFWLLNQALLPLQLAGLAALVSGAHLGTLTANILVLTMVFALRYLASSAWIFRHPQTAPGPPRPPDRVGSVKPVPRGQHPPTDLSEQSAAAAVEASTAKASMSSRGLTWVAGATLILFAGAIAVERPGAWLPVATLILGISVAHLAGWRGRDVRIVALALSVFAATIDYLSWRLTVLSWTAWLVGIPLFLAELHAALHTVGLQLSLWPQHDKPLRKDIDPATLPVLVFIPTVNEGPEILEQTLSGVLAARAAYLKTRPEADLRVIVCNDGLVAGAECSEDVVALAARMQVECITRTLGGGAKAGNFENARQQVGGTGQTLLVIFDADQIPADDFFIQTLEPFADRTVGWVQTGQYYRNRTNPVARWADDQQSLFYRLLCTAKAKHDAAFICGTNVVIRAAALDEIGGLPTDSVTEDFAASILLAPRWRSIYLPGVLATGLGPIDMRSYLRQQERWARGTLTVLRKHWRDLLIPKRGGLRLQQRVQYALAATHYLSGIRDFVFIAAPLLFLFSGISGVRGATLSQFLEHFVPYYLLALVAFWHVGWRTTSWRSIVLGFASTPALLRATWMTVVGRRGTFVVTPKKRNATRWVRIALPYIVALTACTTALVLALTVRWSPTHALAAFWLAYLCAMLGATLCLVSADTRLAWRDAAAARGVARESLPGLPWLNSGRHAEQAAIIRSETGGRIRRRRRSPVNRATLRVAAIAFIALVVLGVVGDQVLAGTRPSTAAAAAVFAGRPRIGLSGTSIGPAQVLMRELGYSASLEGRTFEIGDGFDTDWATQVRESGGVPWITLVLTTHGRPTLASSLTAIRNGVDDAAVSRWAKALANYASPVYLTMLPQVDRNFAASSAVARDGIPSDAAAAWARLHSLLDKAGARNVSLVWGPADPGHDSLYSPPAAQIDAVSVTLYEYPGTVWTDPVTALSAAAANHPGKSLLLEVSVAGSSRASGNASTTPLSRSAWLARLASAASTRRDIAGLVYHVDGPYANPSDPSAKAWGLTGDKAALSATADLFSQLQGSR